MKKIFFVLGLIFIFGMLFLLVFGRAFPSIIKIEKNNESQNKSNSLKISENIFYRQNKKQ